MSEDDHRAGPAEDPSATRPRRPTAGDPPRSPPRRGDLLTAISDGLVTLHKEYYGRGPTQARSYVTDDLVVCVLRGGFTRVEETLLREGRGDAVLAQRRAFQAMMRDRFAAVVEQATGRTVVGCMFGTEQEPDMSCQVFVLGPVDPD